MIITEKFGDALLLALSAPHHRLTRCCKGFRPAGQHGEPPVVTRRTANALVNANLGDYNDRTIPSAMTLTAKGVEAARRYEASRAQVAA